MDRNDLKPRAFRSVLASGDTTVFTVPTNLLGYIRTIEIDSQYLSGQAGVLQFDIRDTFTPTGGAETTEVKKTFGILAGDSIHIDNDAPISVIGAVAIRSQWSGAIASLSVEFE